VARDHAAAAARDLERFLEGEGFYYKYGQLRLPFESDQEDTWYGIVALMSAVRGGVTFIGPMAGTRSEILANLYYRLREKKPDPASPWHVTKPLPMLVSPGALTEWTYDPTSPTRFQHIADIANKIVTYGLPFFRKNISFRNVLNGYLSEGNTTPKVITVYHTPLLYHLLNDDEAALSFIASEIATFPKKIERNSYFEEYLKFAERFRAYVGAK
jgi:hypothetical protein